MIASLGCSSQSGQAPITRPLQRSDVGQRITVEGKATSAKAGALLDGYWIGGTGWEWPRELLGKRIRLTGVVEELADLPVFVYKEGEPPKGGMPVPVGTDLDEARKRLVIAKPTWHVLD